MIFKGAFARDVVEYQPAYELPFTAARDAWGAGGETEFLAAYKARTGDSFLQPVVPTRRRRRRGGRPAGRR